jgi:hypothetical protein
MNINFRNFFTPFLILLCHLSLFLNFVHVRKSLMFLAVTSLHYIHPTFILCQLVPSILISVSLVAFPPLRMCFAYPLFSVQALRGCPVLTVITEYCKRQYDLY